MFTLRAQLKRKDVFINVVDNPDDIDHVMDFLDTHDPYENVLAFDTESTSYKNMYSDDWSARLFQFGNQHESWCIPIDGRLSGVDYTWMVEQVINVNPERQWLCHNGPHDVLTVDLHLGYETGLLKYVTDTRTLSHLLDSRGPQEGGIGHGLKDLTNAFVDRNASQYEKDLKAAFKEITYPLEGEFYKSGKNKGQQKVKKIALSDGYRLIDIYNEQYQIYSGLDPIFTARIYPALMERLNEEYA